MSRKISPKIESLRVRVLRRQHLLKALSKKKKEEKETKKKLKERVTESCKTVQERKSTVDLQMLGIDMMPTYDELFGKAEAKTSEIVSI